MIRMKNTRTGEVRDVEPDSMEHNVLRNGVVDKGDGSPAEEWEELGLTPTRFATRQDLHANDISNVTTELHPERALSQAELEAGITSWEQKQYELGLGPKPKDAPEPSGPTLEELKRLAEERGIEVDGRPTKAKLQEALAAHAETEVPAAEEEEVEEDAG